MDDDIREALERTRKGTIDKLAQEMIDFVREGSARAGNPLSDEVQVLLSALVSEAVTIRAELRERVNKATGAEKIAYMIVAQDCPRLILGLEVVNELALRLVKCDGAMFDPAISFNRTPGHA